MRANSAFIPKLATFSLVYERIVLSSSILRCRIAAMLFRQYDNAAEGYLRGVDSSQNWIAVLAYFMRSAPTLQINASWSPVPPLQPIAPISLPPSTSGNPPGLAVSVGSRVPG